MARTERRSVDDQGTPQTQRLNVQVETAAYERLVVHCLKTKKGAGQMVTDLINANLRQWRVQSNDTARVAGKHRTEHDEEEKKSDAA